MSRIRKSYTRRTKKINSEDYSSLFNAITPMHKHPIKDVIHIITSIIKSCILNTENKSIVNNVNNTVNNNINTVRIFIMISFLIFNK